MTALAFIGARKRLFAVLGLALAALAVLAFVRVRATNAERERQEAAKAVAILEATKTDARAKEKAAETRLQDAAEVAEMKEDLIEAIAETTDSAPSAADVALNCRRLLASGHDVSKLSVCAGSSR